MIDPFLNALGADGPFLDRAGKTDDRRAEGNDIVQLGNRPDGQLARWSFRDITDDAFLWRGEVSADNGKRWRVVTEFTARRK